MSNSNNKVALVTGADGIGFEVAKRLGTDSFMLSTGYEMLLARKKFRLEAAYFCRIRRI